MMISCLEKIVVAKGWRSPVCYIIIHRKPMLYNLNLYPKFWTNGLTIHSTENRHPSDQYLIIFPKKTLVDPTGVRTRCQK
jgi:hypothetical protein